MYSVCYLKGCGDFFEVWCYDLVLGSRPRLMHENASEQKKCPKTKTHSHMCGIHKSGKVSPNTPKWFPI